ncbi:uncharacterized protein [Argopecten irradians]|uniref:uncharacterized protein isoform X2 n=1 Tax=Argopecten irradians TaxID=31199 RepID=UPI00371F8D95
MYSPGNYKAELKYTWRSPDDSSVEDLEGFLIDVNMPSRLLTSSYLLKLDNSSAHRHWSYEVICSYNIPAVDVEVFALCLSLPKCKNNNAEYSLLLNIAPHQSSPVPTVQQHPNPNDDNIRFHSSTTEWLSAASPDEDGKIVPSTSSDPDKNNDVPIFAVVFSFVLVISITCLVWFLRWKVLTCRLKRGESNVDNIANNTTPGASEMDQTGIPWIHKEPSNRDRLHIEPNNRNKLHMEPNNSGRLHMEPNNSGRLHMEPNNSGTLHMEPNNRDRLHMEPNNSGRLHMEPNKTDKVHMEPSNRDRLHMENNKRDRLHMVPNNICILQNCDTYDGHDNMDYSYYQHSPCPIHGHMPSIEKPSGVDVVMGDVDINAIYSKQKRLHIAPLPGEPILMSYLPKGDESRSVNTGDSDDDNCAYPSTTIESKLMKLNEDVF